LLIADIGTTPQPPGTDFTELVGWAAALLAIVEAK
jgi:hypothetical protein